MFLLLSVQLAAGVEHVVQIATGELAVVVVLVILGHIEVHRPLTFVGISVFQYLLYQFYLFDDVSAGLRLNAWAQHVQRIHGLVVAVGVILRHLHRFQLFQARFLGNLVLALICIVLQVAYIGDIAYVAYFISQMLQVTEEQVECNGRTGVTQVRVAIDGRSADVHAHMRGVQRFEYFLCPAQCVVDK